MFLTRDSMIKKKETTYARHTFKHHPEVLCWVHVFVSVSFSFNLISLEMWMCFPFENISMYVIYCDKYDFNLLTNYSLRLMLQLKQKEKQLYENMSICNERQTAHFRPSMKFVHFTPQMTWNCCTVQQIYGQCTHMPRLKWTILTADLIQSNGSKQSNYSFIDGKLGSINSTFQLFIGRICCLTK